MLLTLGLMGLSACQGGPFSSARPGADAQAAACPTHEAAVARVEFQHAGFDGQTVSGRLLMGAASGSLCLDRRLIESHTLAVERVLDCASGQPLPFLIVDVRTPPRREEDILLLAPGQWYGRDVSVPLFPQPATGQPGPGCVDVELSVHALDAANIAKPRLRVTRAPAPIPESGAPPSGGTSREPPPTKPAP
ncbi:hypothetical protein [Corallococcus carmarthensis]|uniref:Uncharacterized protein n=1 Tax=Corallococcus carmarthensis TaxID=2316728 RepID=A0A3A8JZ44_9BACT|nr:hypothetical protein [Corallococcus carmarthensis]RKG97494.1 hypothetical protein D7X32_32565 [Corallococcus carmarthensis]